MADEVSSAIETNSLPEPPVITAHVEGQSIKVVKLTIPDSFSGCHVQFLISHRSLWKKTLLFGGSWTMHYMLVVLIWMSMPYTLMMERLTNKPRAVNLLETM